MVASAPSRACVAPSDTFVWLLGLIAGTSTGVYYLVEMVRSPGPDDSVLILPIGSLLFLEAMLLLRVRIAERARRRVES